MKKFMFILSLAICMIATTNSFANNGDGNRTPKNNGDNNSKLKTTIRCGSERGIRPKSKTYTKMTTGKSSSHKKNFNKRKYGHMRKAH